MTTETPQTLEQTILQTTSDKKPETVTQLIDFVRQTSLASKDEILNTIIQLQSQGKLKLTTLQYEPVNLSALLKTSHAAWFWITITLTYAAVIAAFTIPVDSQPIASVRDVLGAIFVLWAPGYALIKALFPTEPLSKTSTKELDIIERFGLSIGLSLALVSLVGLLLNYTSWGITLAPVVLSLAAFTTIFAVVAVIREKRQVTPKNLSLHAKKIEEI